jgi:hypothetical protein
VSADPGGLCKDCGAPHRADQQYCLSCGARIAERSPLLEPLLRGVRKPSLPRAAAPAPVTPPVAARPSGLGLTLPTPRVSVVLVLAFLGFGVLVGNAASPHVEDTLASARAPVKLILPPATASAGSASASASPPASSAEATPEPSESSTPAAATAKTPAAKKPATGKSAPGAAGGERGSSESPSSGSSSKLPPVKHVFLIALADEPYASVFGPASTASYLSQTLEHRGELLVRYYAVAHEELANEVALISGQGPTTETAANCPNYTDIAPATVGASEQVAGQGCVYPSTTQTLAGQLSEKHLSWRAYVEGMDEGGAAGGACAHPVVGQPDPSAAATLPAGQTYATFRNPFVYFQSLIDSPSCAADDVGIKSLSSDLADPARVPSLSYIVPDRCHDGSPAPCAPGAPSGPPAADGFLQKVVPEILASRAYKKGGLIIITVDEAPSSGAFADSSSCCGQPQFPNLPAATGTVAGLPSKGGGEVGALLISPYVKANTTNQEQYNHFSLLRTIEDLYKLKHLGYAGSSGVSSFAPSLFSAYKG